MSWANGSIPRRRLRISSPTTRRTPSRSSGLKAFRESAKLFANVLTEVCEPGADQAASMRLLRECVMTGNASILRVGEVNPDGTRKP